MANDETFADTMPDIFGSVIFCDDLRFENTNKAIAIGIYNVTMQLVGTFPFQARSFAMLIYYSERIGTQKEPVKIQVYFPATPEPVAEISLPLDQVRNQPSPPNIPNPSFLCVTIPVVMGPVTFAGAGNILVIARIGDRVQRLGALRIELISFGPPPPNQSQDKSTPPVKEDAN